MAAKVYTDKNADLKVLKDQKIKVLKDLKDLLESHGCRGKRLGVEYHAYGLTGQRAKMVDAALDGFCELIDASDLVRLLRLVKSSAELDYVRRSGELGDEIFAVSRASTRPGTTVKTVYADMLRALVAGGGDPTASRWPNLCTAALPTSPVPAAQTRWPRYLAPLCYCATTGSCQHWRISWKRQ